MDAESRSRGDAAAAAESSDEVALHFDWWLRSISENNHESYQESDIRI